MIQIAGETNFNDKMQNEILPFLKKRKRSGQFQSFDGTRIYYEYYLNPKEKAAIVFSHGFCEFTEKFEEMTYYFYQAGYSVFLMDHRGHGKSQRYVKDLSKVYVNSYDEYVKDLKRYIDRIVIRRSFTKKLYLFGHSMGGAIAALLMEEYPSLISRAVLSAPMFEMQFGNVPEHVTGALRFMAVRLHLAEKYAVGQRPFQDKPSFETSGFASKARYQYIFKKRIDNVRYRTRGATYGWACASMDAVEKLQENAYRIQTPILLIQAQKDTMVKLGGQNRFAKNTPNTKLLRFPDAKHEVFHGTDRMRLRFYRNIFAFYEKDEG